VSPKPKIFPPKLKPCFHLSLTVHPCGITSTLRKLFQCAHQTWGIILSLQKIGERFHKVGVWLGHCTLQLVYRTIATPQPQNMLLLLSPWHNELAMTSWVWWPFLPTHANCHTSINRAQPTLSVNAWRLAQDGRNGRQKTLPQAAMQGHRAPPLSLLDNIKTISF
jgi:hypothetical protein